MRHAAAMAYFFWISTSYITSRCRAATRRFPSPTPTPAVMQTGGRVDWTIGPAVGGGGGGRSGVKRGRGRPGWRCWSGPGRGGGGGRCGGGEEGAVECRGVVVVQWGVAPALILVCTLAPGGRARPPHRRGGIHRGPRGGGGVGDLRAMVVVLGETTARRAGENRARHDFVDD